MSPAVEQLAALVLERTGIRLREHQLDSLAAAAARVAPDLDQLHLLRRLRGADGELWRRLIDEVTINETFFFRHPADLLAIDWRALQLVAREAGSDTVRVWVAGCATGEEAYTLAILAAETFVAGRVPVSILATDISAAALAAGERARYGRRAVRGISPELRERYFSAEGGRHVVGRQLRSIVRFASHNLVGDLIPPAQTASFELITCRNTLIYFDPGTVDRVMSSLRSALSPGGKLLLGAADQISSSLPAASGPSPSGRKRSRPLAASTATSTIEAAKARRPSVHQPGIPKLDEAISAANAGLLGTAIEIATRIVQLEPLNADAHIVRGLAELGVDNAAAAIASLRRALYVRPDSAMIAFHLGRALEVSGDSIAAARSFRQAIRILDDSQRDEEVSSVDIAAACALRLRAIRQPAGDPR